jgi:hypothetical protein
MRTTLLALITFLLLAITFLLLAAGASAQTADQVAWMAGCWRQASEGRTVDEMWMAPAGGTMVGVSRTVAGSRTVAYEFLRIHEDGGRLTFTAKPSGQNEASFAVLTIGLRDVVFENPTHDFPRRVRYRLENDTLVGRIEGTLNGKPRSVDYPMRRVDCPR